MNKSLVAIVAWGLSSASSALAQTLTADQIRIGATTETSTSVPGRLKGDADGQGLWLEDAGLGWANSSENKWLAYRGGQNQIIMRNFSTTAGDDNAIVWIWAPPRALAADTEATLTLMRSDGLLTTNNEFVDLYNNGYNSTGFVNYGLLLQKRGTGSWRDFVVHYSDGSGTGNFIEAFRVKAPVGTRADTQFTGRLGWIASPTAVLHLKAGTTAANTAPMKFTSGALLTAPEAGAVEFLTDAYYATITTGAARRTFAFLEGPTFTGTVTIPTPFTLGATSVTTTGVQLNYLNASTGTTGTTSTNVVFSTSPTLTTPTIGAATATSIAIGANTLNTSEWAFLDGVDQSVATTSSPTHVDLTLTGGDVIASTATTWNVLNTVATTVNAFGAATTIGVGAASGTITLGSNTTLNGGAAANDDLTVQGTSHATRTTSYVTLQPNGGNVGIGTATPGRLVEAQTGGTIDTQLRLTSANDRGTSIEYFSNNLTHNWWVGNNLVYTNEFQWVPSTAAGGSTFTTPVFRIRPTDGLASFTGALGVGTAAPDGKLHVHTATAGVVTANGSADDLVVENSANVGLSFLSPNTNTQTIAFGDPENSAIGQIYYNHSTNALGLYANGSEAVKIDSTQQVGIGATPSARLHVAGTTRLGAGSGNVQIGMDGWDLLKWSGSTAHFGGITAAQWSVVDLYTGGTARTRLDASGHLIPVADNSYNLGQTAGSNLRWKDIFAVTKTSALDVSWGSGRVLVSVLEGPEYLLYDSGTVTLDVAGSARVAFDARFVETTTTTMPYRVMTGGATVSQKTPTGFRLQGPPGADVDWMVVATRAGFENVRWRDPSLEDQEPLGLYDPWDARNRKDRENNTTRERPGQRRVSVPRTVADEAVGPGPLEAR